MHVGVCCEPRPRLFFKMDLLISLLLLLPCICNGQNYSSVTEPVYNGQDIIITAQYGDTIDIYCAVYDNTTQVATTWEVESGGSYTPVSFALDTGVGTGAYTYLRVSPLAAKTNLSISFDSSVDPLRLGCSIASETQAVFYIGKPSKFVFFLCINIYIPLFT